MALFHRCHTSLQGSLSTVSFLSDSYNGFSPVLAFSRRFSG